jgi:hypothetical protein
LLNIEKGSASVALGAYSRMLFGSAGSKTSLKLVGDDPLGRKLQDARLLVKERATKR